MITKKLAPALATTMLAVALIAAIALQPLVAFGWTSETEGNTSTENSSSINGETSGETNVQGWIGTFNGEEDATMPDPPAEAWVNVKIPTTALFGSLSTDNGDIYSPQYHIYNQSVREVSVTPTSFTAKTTEAAELSGMTLDLNFTAPNALTVALRNMSDAFLGNGISNSQSITLAAANESNPSIANFNISGELPAGFTYPSDAPYKPSYGLIFTFESGSAA